MFLFNSYCKSKARLDNKTALITGCNTGIGKETALDFYKRGARVIMACRNIDKTEEAKDDIINKCQNVSDLGALIIQKCDLSSLKSVRECAQNILDTEPQINILVNNAGIMLHPQQLTEDGFEMHLATNHLGHFLLTMLLLPRIRNSTPARIITVSSCAHEFKYGIDLNDLHYRHREYHPLGAYTQSKLANVLFSKQLASKLKEHNIQDINCYSLHPGVIATDLLRHIDDTIFAGAHALWHTITPTFIKTPHRGAQTTIFCALDEKCAHETGLYYSECAVTKPHKTALNDEYAQKLWDISVEQVDLGDYDPFTAIDDEGIAK